MSEPNGFRRHDRTSQARPLLRALLGDVLRRIRRRQRRTLADVAADARMSMAYLSELERGRKEASSEVLAAVCDALRVELADVLAEAGRVLVAERTRRTSGAVVRLDSIRGRDGRSSSVPAAPTGPAHRPDDALCILAA